MKKIEKLLKSLVEEDVILGIEILKTQKSFPKNLFETGVRNEIFFKFIKVNFDKNIDIIGLMLGGKRYHKYLKVYKKTGKIQLL